MIKKSDAKIIIRSNKSFEVSIILLFVICLCAYFFKVEAAEGITILGMVYVFLTVFLLIYVLRIFCNNNLYFYDDKIIIYNKLIFTKYIIYLKDINNVSLKIAREGNIFIITTKNKKKSFCVSNYHGKEYREIKKFFDEKNILFDYSRVFKAGSLD